MSKLWRLWPKATLATLIASASILSIGVALPLGTAFAQKDPGVRGGAPGAGGPLVGLNPDELALWTAAQQRFQKVYSVSGTIESGVGLGPKFDSNSCASCHAAPAIGGGSPATNPQIAVATLDGATNKIPPLITLNGPAREMRYKSDGAVHDLFTIQGRTDAPGCTAAQPDFTKKNNLAFRIPTPLFGLGLVENTPDATLQADAANQESVRRQLMIAGHFNHKKGGLDSDSDHDSDPGFNSHTLNFSESSNTGTINPVAMVATHRPGESECPAVQPRRRARLGTRARDFGAPGARQQLSRDHPGAERMRPAVG